MAPLAQRITALLERAIRFGRTELAALCALLTAAGGGLAFIEIADDASEADGQRFDQFILDWLRPGADPRDALGPPWLERAMGELTALGGIAPLVLIASLAVAFLLLKRRGGSALLVALSLSGGVVISQTLKALYNRDRPPDIFRAEEVINASFPSGHAMLSTITYLTLGALLAQAMDRRRLKIFIFAAAVLIAALVGMSRVYLAVHWASDVLAGWSLGAAWAMACWLVAWLVERRRGLLSPAPRPKDPTVTGE
ncbi:phosphatase PAP2 family protein [Caulobacter segnis]|uniref:phosphatase PAP2 family protein n=1 Tax=Caulobacter segnis TaxID=88688 RepID=UPI00241023BB|nr:phosphatase PAP2 family protein [Caulobacter segnis]MDG2520783.1 phosphatase PAP2 family protein [Caulobacter segnis]